MKKELHKIRIHKDNTIEVFASCGPSGCPSCVCNSGCVACSCSTIESQASYTMLKQGAGAQVDLIHLTPYNTIFSSTMYGTNVP